MGDEVQRFTFASPEVAASFAVDQERRTIAGMAVPWGAVAQSGFALWKFQKGSLQWGDETRIKLNEDHDSRELLGYAQSIVSTDRGLNVVFKIGRGEDGDRALMSAEDKIRDGFSIEVDFDGANDWIVDPTNEDVRLVQRATLRGVALTGVPAFDDARVTRVTATRDEKEGRRMGDEERNNQGGGGAGAAVEDGDRDPVLHDMLDGMRATFERMPAQIETSMSRVVESNAQTIGGLIEQLRDPQGGGRPEVSAARVRFRNDPPVYTFDGNGSGHSFLRDSLNAYSRHDTEALERLRRWEEQSKYVASQFKPSGPVGPQFAVTSSNAGQIIPPEYRPDLYVSMLLQGRPFVDAASRGTLDNATPFTVPTFTSASGLAGTHTEGTNPSEGAIVFGTRTVTPKAISGRITVSREMVDAANPAIDAIIVNTMREKYAQQTEAEVYALLNGSAGQGGTITSGFVPSGAQVATTTGQGDELLVGIRLAESLYPFRRFAAPSRGLLSQEAVSSLATGMDTTGRPLLPSVGATNAVGVAQAGDAQWVIDGIPFAAAWSMTGNAAGDADVMMVRESDLWVWESNLLQFRYEEKQGPALIEFAIFGYFACHLLRPVGLSAIRHTAA